MYVYLYNIQKTTLKGNAIYKLVGIVKYQNRHYSLLYSPQKTILDGSISVTLMYVQNCILYNQITRLLLLIQQNHSTRSIFYQSDEFTNVHALFIPKM